MTTNLTRRQFFPLAIMTPLAAKLLLEPTESPASIGILESTAKGRRDFGPDWDAACKACDKWVQNYAHMYFTGFKLGMGSPVMAGQFLWNGVATYRSGAKETVFYYVSMTIAPAEVWDPPALAPHIDRCMVSVNRFKTQFDHDGTITTVKNSRRRVAGIEWYEDERYSGIPVPMHNPDPRRIVKGEDGVYKLRRSA